MNSNNTEIKMNTVTNTENAVATPKKDNASLPISPSSTSRKEPERANTHDHSNAESPFVIAIDHGYGNIKTPTFIFPACVTPCDQEMSFAMNDVLTYEDKRYAIGTGHKEFRQDKIMDDDYYILTLAAIARSCGIGA